MRSGTDLNGDNFLQGPRVITVGLGLGYRLGFGSGLGTGSGLELRLGLGLGLQIVAYKLLEKATKCGSVT